MSESKPPRLPKHIRDMLRKDPMALQRKHDEEVASFRLATGADVWNANPSPQTRAMGTASTPPYIEHKQGGEVETLYRWRGPRGGWIYDARKPSWPSEQLEVRRSALIGGDAQEGSKP